MRQVFRLQRIRFKPIARGLFRRRMIAARSPLRPRPPPWPSNAFKSWSRRGRASSSKHRDQGGGNRKHNFFPVPTRAWRRPFGLFPVRLSSLGPRCRAGRIGRRFVANCPNYYVDFGINSSSRLNIFFSCHRL
jgi:hypothetical protein